MFGGNRLGFSNAVRMQPGPSGGARDGPSSPVRGRYAPAGLPPGAGLPTVEGNGLGYMGALDRCDSVRDFDEQEHAPPAPRPPAAPEANAPQRQMQMYVAPPRAIHMAMPRPNSSGGSQRWGVRPPSGNNPFKHSGLRPGSAGPARPGVASSPPANTGVAGAMHHAAKRVAPEFSMVIYLLPTPATRKRNYALYTPSIFRGHTVELSLSPIRSYQFGEYQLGPVSLKS